jgi:protein-S-isoprenylcysteine O-methyltransferase Ste14
LFAAGAPGSLPARVLRESVPPHRTVGLPPIPPPVFALAYLVLAAVVDRATGADRLVPAPFHLLGVAGVLAGAGLVARALRVFRRAGTTHVPGERPSALVESGPYRRTRNPMYLGIGLALLGLAALIGSWPFFLVPPAFALTVDRLFIPREERALDEAFGHRFRDYRRRVRRWM